METEVCILFCGIIIIICGFLMRAQMRRGKCYVLPTCQVGHQEIFSVTSFDLHKYAKLQIEWTLICSKMRMLYISIPLNLWFTWSSMAFYTDCQPDNDTVAVAYIYTNLVITFLYIFMYTSSNSWAACNCHFKYQQTLHYDLACVMCVKDGTLTIQQDMNWQWSVQPSF